MYLLIISKYNNFTGVNENNSNNLNAIIFPNPSSGNYNISLAGAKGETSINIF